MAERLRPIIVVKKIKKHAGHHGGQWKVADADFITALMAFPLLLWLGTRGQKGRLRGRDRRGEGKGFAAG